MSVTRASALRPASSSRFDPFEDTWVQAAVVASPDKAGMIGAKDPATSQVAENVVAATDAETPRCLVAKPPIPARYFLRTLRLRPNRWRTHLCDPPRKTFGRQLENLTVPPVTCRARAARAPLVAIAGWWVASASVDR